MKPITIFACIFLIKTIEASLPSPCDIPCAKYKKFKGEVSANLQISQNVYMVYSKEEKIFFIDNAKDNIIFVTHGEIVYIINIQSKQYLVIDQRSKCALQEKFEIDMEFRKDYNILIKQLIIILANHTEITKETTASFDFDLIVEGYYSNNFDLEKIFSFDAKLAAELKASFGGVFALMHVGIERGVVTPCRGVWGLYTAVLGVEADVGVALIDSIRLSVDHFSELHIKVVANIVSSFAVSAKAFVDFSLNFLHYISAKVNVTIDAVNNWAVQVKNKPVEINLPIGKASYKFKFVQIDGVYLSEFNIHSQLFKFDLHIQKLYLNGVLLIINQHTGVAIAFYGRQFAIIHLVCGQVLVGSWSLLGGVRGAFTVSENLAASIQVNNYYNAVILIKQTIDTYKSKTTFRFKDLMDAMKGKQISKIETIVGEEHAVVFQASFSVYFSQCTGATMGGIGVGIFANAQSALALAISTTLNVISTTTALWSTFFSITFKGQILING